MQQGQIPPEHEDGAGTDEIEQRPQERRRQGQRRHAAAREGEQHEKAGAVEQTPRGGTRRGNAAAAIAHRHHLPRGHHQQRHQHQGDAFQFRRTHPQRGEIAGEDQAQATDPAGGARQHAGFEPFAISDPQRHRIDRYQQRREQGDDPTRQSRQGQVRDLVVEPEHEQPQSSETGMVAGSQFRQLATRQQPREQQYAGAAHAIDQGDLHRHHTGLQFRGKPGRAPDERYPGEQQHILHARCPQCCRKCAGFGAGPRGRTHGVLVMQHRVAASSARRHRVSSTWSLIPIPVR